MNKLLVIGVIHSCYDELKELVETADLDSSDVIATVGDIWSMGPKPKETLAYIKEKKIIDALSHHDVQHLFAESNNPKGALVASVNICRERQAGPEASAEFVDYLSHQARAIVTPYCDIVHAGIDPRVPLEQQDPVIMMGEGPSLDGKLMEELGDYWYKFYDWPKPMVIGPTHFNQVRRFGVTSENPNDPFDWRNPGEGRVIGLETDCVRGGRLTGILFSPQNPEGEFLSVAAKENYWERVQEEFGVKPKIWTLENMVQEERRRWTAYCDSMASRLDAIQTIPRVRTVTAITLDEASEGAGRGSLDVNRDEIRTVPNPAEKKIER
jgi:hypothetical protein